jgi:hypothetical protein
VDISPDHPVKLAGYDLFFFDEETCRWSTGVHDPIYATAAAFQNGDDPPAVLIHLDVVGALTTDVVRIQDGVASTLGIPEESVLVAASHSHGSPDTVGLWGLILPPITGRYGPFIETMIQGAVEAGVRAWEAMAPASLRAATGSEAALHVNPQTSLDPDAITDDTMAVLAAYDGQGALIGTLMSWGCHPMVMGPENTLITADFPGAYYRIMDQELGGVHLYLNSSLGATVHPRVPDDPSSFQDPGSIQGKAANTWEDMERFARALADDVNELLDRAEPLVSYEMVLISQTIYGKLENPIFSLAGELEIIPRDMPPLGEMGATAVTAFSIGDVRFGTVPGELVPDLGLEARAIMGGSHPFLITLGMDWLGYIMTREQYENLGYIYFSILSVGPATGEAVLDAYHGLFDDWPG